MKSDFVANYESIYGFDETHKFADASSELLVPRYGNNVGCPTTDGNFLNDAYLAFDLRDSYLQRQAMPLA